MNEKARTIVFNISALLFACRCGIISGIAGCSSLPVRHRSCRYSSQLPDNAYQGYGFPQTQVAPLQYICRIAMHIRLRPDVQRTERWVICLTISALLQLYTAFVAPKKEN